MTVADDRAVDENAAATKQTAAAGRGPRVVFSHQAVYELVGNAAAIACDTAGIAGIANEDETRRILAADFSDGRFVERNRAGLVVGGLVEEGPEDHAGVVDPAADHAAVLLDDERREPGRGEAFDADAPAGALLPDEEAEFVAQFEKTGDPAGSGRRGCSWRRCRAAT